MSIRRTLVGTVGAGAAAALLSLVATWEGKSNDPYRDIVGVWTVCYGETKVPMKRYSDAECTAMLEESLIGYAEPVLARNPELRGHLSQLAAAVSLTYNIGPANYHGSRAARYFSAGEWRRGCDSFLSWNKVTVPASSVRGYRNRGETCHQTRSGRWLCSVKGLTNRRNAERKLCLEGL